jgi:hypothetical protein
MSDSIGMAVFTCAYLWVPSTLCGVTRPEMDKTMASEAWFYNPHSYVKELAECGVGNVAWDRGSLIKRHIDPIKHADLYFGAAIPWRSILVGPQGAAEYQRGCTPDKPVAVYPVWEYGDDFGILEELVESPLGEDEASCTQDGEPDEIPVFGQEHRVIITRLPPANTGPGRKFLTLLRELQEDHPEAILHLHPAGSWRTAFGYGLRAASVEARLPAQKGKVILPTGAEKPHDYLFSNAKWARILDFKPSDLTVPRNRCMYNIKSAIWASKNYTELIRYKTNRSGDLVPDVDTPDSMFIPEETKSPLPTGVAKKSGDMVTCDTCSLQDKCVHYREGAVCSLPHAEPVELSAMFGSRDSNVILDGLATLLSSQAKRLKRGMRSEVLDGEIDPKVTALANSIFNQGVQMAKLVDPNLRAGAKVQVNVNGQTASAQVLTATPQQMMAGIIAELEQRGIPRSQITPDMIKGLLSTHGNGGVPVPPPPPPPGIPAAITGEVIKHE